VHKGACDPQSSLDPEDCYVSWNGYGYDELFANWPGSWSDSGGGWVWNENTAVHSWFSGAAEKSDLNISGTVHWNLAVGWDFPLSPFRIELEYSRLSMKSNSYDLQISGYDEGYVFRTWKFNNAPNVGDSRTVDMNFTTTMLNTYFELPLFPYTGIGPYIGYGVGLGKLDFGNYGGSKSLWVNQLMLGVEYRFQDTPYIVALEYRRMDIPGMPERDNSSAEWYYVDESDSSYDGDRSSPQQSYIDYSNQSIMLKFRYDFMSDDF